MPRFRTSRTVTIPEGFTLHDGKGCPVDPESCPRVIFRIGTRTTNRRPAGHWIEMGEGSAWEWEEGSRAAMDIIAYQPEPEVVIPRMSLEEFGAAQD